MTDNNICIQCGDPIYGTYCGSCYAVKWAVAKMEQHFNAKEMAELLEQLDAEEMINLACTL